MFEDINTLDYYTHNMFKKLLTYFIILLYKTNNDNIYLDPLELRTISGKLYNIPEIYILYEEVELQYADGHIFTIYFNYLSKDNLISVWLLSDNKSFTHHFQINNLEELFPQVENKFSEFRINLIEDNYKEKFFQLLKKTSDIKFGYKLISFIVRELRKSI